MAHHPAVKATGALLTAIGLILMIYAFVIGPIHGKIGSKSAWTSDAISMILGWYFIIVGPALYFGEAPAKLRREAAKEKQSTS
ncbi:hypothetical protein PYJP_02450 [Pyrofollis japonicus]|uniref:hypothetical protein n=1 Tax=Pyrofollis japonicus TaxID=3060460 RepID=UPI00295C01D2|nr:hypothetical protein [Pyrofollis japonicus]BEP16893.1 hypothetical protein PYJP_02450 [Pyrofollis japonicus]